MNTCTEAPRTTLDLSDPPTPDLTPSPRTLRVLLFDDPTATDTDESVAIGYWHVTGRHETILDELTAELHQVVARFAKRYAAALKASRGQAP